jgi:hypothetical protein
MQLLEDLSASPRLPSIIPSAVSSGPSRSGHEAVERSSSKSGGFPLRCKVREMGKCAGLADSDFEFRKLLIVFLINQKDYESCKPCNTLMQCFSNVSWVAAHSCKRAKFRLSESLQRI